MEEFARRDEVDDLAAAILEQVEHHHDTALDPDKVGGAVTGEIDRRVAGQCAAGFLDHGSGSGVVRS